uniref:Reverse transcriptase domain-containing protein n=1 Tax=Tanacetum cinerariifolium TaxID=118510 RepID=A0A6L2K7F5_TANCI|nr:reverse transcriptase domain-containing protein [Tanacetum cinerariifolium]
MPTKIELTLEQSQQSVSYDVLAPTEGYGEAIVIPKINADHFEIKTNLLQLVQANPYHGFERENPHTHINNFKRITSTLKFKDVPNNVIKLMMFSYSLEGNARVWYDKEPLNSILTWEDLINKFVNQFFPPSKTTHLKNEISCFTQRFEETFGEAWEQFKEMLRACPHHGFMELAQIDTFYNGLNDNDQDSLNAAAGENLLNQISTLVDIFAKKIITPAPVKAVEESCVACGGTLSSDTIPNPKGEMKAITTRSGVAYQEPSIPTPKKVVVQETDETTDKEQSNFQRSNTHIQPPAIPIPEPDVPKTISKPNLPYPSRLNDQKLCEKSTNQIESFFQIFQDLHFDISFADALLLMPKFASTIKTMLLKKLGDPGKFLILCDFPGMDVCHALADLGTSINLMPLSIWKKLSLHELTPTRMTLELVDRSITRPKGVVEDVFVKVGKFHFLTDFVVVDFEADPRVPHILGRSFLRTGRALIDIYGEEITLRVNDEVVTFNLNQTMRYSSTYDDLSVNRIDIIDVAREEYAEEILGFSSNSSGSRPTLTFEPILFDSSPSLTPFEGSDFILEEIEAYLKDDLISPEIDHADFDPEGDTCLIEKLLNDEPLQVPSMDLKEVIKAKSLIEEPPEVESKDLPSHFEYAYLEENDKLPVIISKDLKDKEKEALLNVLKSHKHTIAWKITDIKVIKKEVLKLLDAGMIYPISDSPWVSPIHCVPKKGGITVVANEENELIPTSLVTGWRVCINYRKLNEATRKDHFPLPFMDQMLERLAGNEFYCFLDEFLGYFQIPIDPQDQEKTTFTCPYGSFTYRRMPFGLCNALETFQRCMMAIFHDMIEKTIEVLMDDFSVFKDSFDTCLFNLERMLKRPMTHLLEKETPFVFSKDCIDAFETLKKKLTEAPFLVIPDSNLPFELMCDASDFAIGAVLGQHQIIRRFVHGQEAFDILKACHEGPPGSIMTSGQVEVSNYGLKRILERTIGENCASWSDKLDDALWAFRTAFKTPIGCTPYKLVYEKSCHLPIELEHKAYWALKHANFDLKTAGDHQKLHLNELRDQAYENFLIYKKRTKKLHDSKIKNRKFQCWNGYCKNHEKRAKNQAITDTRTERANDAILKNMQTNMTSLTNSNLELKNMFGQFMKMNTASSSGSGTLPNNTITNPKKDLKVVEREIKVTKETMPPTNNGSTKDVQPSVVQIETPIPNSKPVVAPVAELVVAPISAPKPNLKPSIPYPLDFMNKSSATRLMIKRRNFSKSSKI